MLPIANTSFLRSSVRTPENSDVIVTGLRTVVFTNTKVPLLAIPVIDEAGNPANDMTNITCSTGICNVRSIAFSDLYEFVLSNGTLVDVSAYVTIEGRALLAFADTRRRLEYNDYPFVELADISVLESTGVGIGGQAVNDAELKAVIASDDEEAATEFRLHVDLVPPEISQKSSAVSLSGCVSSLFMAGISALALLLV